MIKYKPNEWFWPALDNAWWFKAWNHWLNPLGNWHEPMPFPIGRVNDGYKSVWYKVFGDPLGMWLFWAFRNFAHNFGQCWIGITPIGERYEWLDPELNGWYLNHHRLGKVEIRSWQKGWIRLPYINIKLGGWEVGIGWKGDGGIGAHFRRD